MLSEKPRNGLSETRKMTKSTMEKKRRARINNSLTELKSILGGMVTNKGERFDKMEKADILEMTVRCVRQLQKQSNTGDKVSGLPRDEDYRSGMHTCMSEVIKFISSASFSNTDPEVKTKLLDHLATKLHSGNKQDSYQEPSSTNSCQDDSYETNVNVNYKENASLSTQSVVSDSNNNIKAIHDKNSSFEKLGHLQKSPSIPSPLASPLFATSYKPATSVMDPSQQQHQQQQSVPTVPLTILVPANFCSTPVGTTCMIPVNLPTASPQIAQNGILATVSQPSQTNFAINSGSALSFIPSPTVIQNAQGSLNGCEVMQLSPDSRVFTIAHAVVPDSQNASVETVIAPGKGNTNVISTSPTLRETTTSHLKPNETATSLQVFRSQRPVFETPQKQLNELQNKRCLTYSPENNTSKCSSTQSSSSISSPTPMNHLNPDSRPSGYFISIRGDSGKQQRYKDNDSVPAEDDTNSCNRQYGNICDSTSAGMWRPW